MSEDVVIVGGGHNGLTCAAYLARRGRGVTVFEAREVVGGLCTTEEAVPEAPGFKMNPASIDQIFAGMPGSIVPELDLESYGLRWLTPDPAYSYVHPSGATLLFWHDIDRTAAEIRKFSAVDAERYRQLVTVMGDIWHVGLPYLQGHPKRVRPLDVGRMVVRGAAARRSLPRGLRAMLQSPAAVIEEWFESDEVRAALASFAVCSMAPVDEPGSGLIMSLLALIHGFGALRPVGGNGAFTQALADCVTAHGGRIVAGRRVEQVLIDGGRATGVELDTGERVAASDVVAALDPWTLVHRLLPPGAFDDQVYAELRGMSVHRNNVSVFKADVALREQMTLPGIDEEPSVLSGCMMFCSGLPAVRRATTASSYGELTEDPPLWVIMPSYLDRSLVPKGDPGHSLYVYVPTAPLALRHSSWVREREGHFERCLDILEKHAPGTRDLIIGVNITSPDDLARYSAGVHRGHLFHVDMDPAQMGPWRPVPSLAGYRTPIERLWHTGAGAHPMGAVNGWSGRSTARMMLAGQRGGRRAH